MSLGKEDVLSLYVSCAERFVFTHQAAKWLEAVLALSPPPAHHTILLVYTVHRTTAQSKLCVDQVRSQWHSHHLLELLDGLNGPAGENACDLKQSASRGHSTSFKADIRMVWMPSFLAATRLLRCESDKVSSDRDARRTASLTGQYHPRRQSPRLSHLDDQAQADRRRDPVSCTREPVNSALENTSESGHSPQLLDRTLDKKVKHALQQLSRRSGSVGIGSCLLEGLGQQLEWNGAARRDR